MRVYIIYASTNTQSQGSAYEAVYTASPLLRPIRALDKALRDTSDDTQNEGTYTCNLSGSQVQLAQSSAYKAVCTASVLLRPIRAVDKALRDTSDDTQNEGTYTCNLSGSLVHEM